MGRAAVATYLGRGQETVRRWEIGESTPNLSTVRDLVKLYGASAEEFSRLTSLLASSKQRGLYEGADVPPELRYLYESEATCLALDAVELENIPGLLQTPEYHQAVQRAQLAEPVPFETALRNLRRQRQELTLHTGTRPQMRWVIGESAIRYLLAEDAALRDDQLDRLRDVDSYPEAEIRVVARFHAAMLGSFTLITPVGAGRFVYLEGLDGGRYIEARDVLSRYTAAFDAVHAIAIPLEEYLTWFLANGESPAAAAATRATASRPA